MEAESGQKDVESYVVAEPAEGNCIKLSDSPPLRISQDWSNAPRYADVKCYEVFSIT